MDKKIIVILFCLISFSLTFGCIEEVREKPVLWVYKLQENYHEQVSFILTQDNEVGAYPILPSASEINISNDFYYSIGPKYREEASLKYMVVTDIELENLQNWRQTNNRNQLKEHIIEMNPFVEAYYCDIYLEISQNPEKINLITQSLTIKEIPEECEKIVFIQRNLE